MFPTIASSTACCLILLQLVSLPNHLVHAKEYGAGEIDNMSTYRALTAASVHRQGDYYIQNVATKGWLSYHQHPQTIRPADKSERSVINLSKYGPGTRVKPRQSNNKCLAAQFNSQAGVDWAATMYACSTFNTPRPDAGNPTNKQQWLFLPVRGTRNTYQIIAVDHLTDMHTRALSSRSFETAGGYTSTSIDLLNTRDRTQMWKLVKA